MGKRWSRKSNCYGYAMNINRWLVLNSFEFGSHSRVNEVAAECNKELLEEFSNLKPVSREDMQLGKEYVAMRIGPEDFHFMKRLKTGHWRHKQGYLPVEAISERKVFDPRGWYARGLNIYSSNVYIYEIEA